jgi:hypothetical protein
MVALSWATVLFEVIAPFALIWSRRTCVAFCAAAVAFHLLVTWLMHINFVDWIVVDVTIAAAAVAGPLLHPRAPGH